MYGYTHVFVPMCTIYGLSCVYEQKSVYLPLCYENDLLVLLFVCYLSNKKDHERSVDLECRVVATEKGICKECVH